jgi:uncharacterized protein (AIM24 family)
MRYKITGDNLQIVTLEIAPKEIIYAEAGAMIHMSGNINMEAKARGGIWKGGNAPGTIKPVPLTQGRDFLCQKDAFLCAENGVELDMAFQQKLGASFFGGEGFIIQRLFGNGTAFIHACGDFVEMDLKPGQLIKVDTGNVVGWDSTVSYDIQRVKGIKTMFFGGEGIFLTTLTGPGKVILQSMTLHNLATALSPFLPQAESGTSGGGGLFD